MGWFAKFMLFLGIALYIIYRKIEFSETMEIFLLSVLVGIGIFILFSIISGLRHMNLIRKFKKEMKGMKEPHSFSGIKGKIKRNRIIAVIILVISIIVFLNSYLYVKAMLGNDMLISLKVDKENLVLKNGEEGQLNVNAKVLTNPFCRANCSIILEDLSTGRVIGSESIYIKVSTPLSKTYSVSSNNDKSGQTLYKISLECNTTKSRFCYGKDVSKSRSRIISEDYELNDIQKQRKDEIRFSIENLGNRFYEAQNSLNNLKINFSFLDLSDFYEEYESLLIISYSLSEEIDNLINLYENQEYSELESKIPEFQEKIGNFENRVNGLKLLVNSNIDSYNLLINDVRLMYYDISYMEDFNFSDYSISYVNSFIKEFNQMILNLDEYNRIETKIALFNYLKSEKEDLFSMLQNETEYNLSMQNPLNISIYPVNLSKISIEEKEYDFDFILNEPLSICCLKNECYKCIDNPSINYPVILVHGHSFNEKLSAELSMESFGDMAKQLEKDGYVDAGYFYRSQYDEVSEGYLGKINSPVVVEATYYLDTQITEEGSFIFDSKLESIDTYASRLNEVINNVRYITGKDKVVIVAHSMGCLVSRRYVQLYGEENVDKLILVGGPNKGIDGFILSYCPVFGADIECSEMNKNSSFIYELNNAPIPTIPVYNIIGKGCLLEGSDSDGIVKEESVYLDWAENIYFNGTCSGVDFFHTRMIKPNREPEIYAVIKDLIEK